eukprot:10524459-Alexandrium_andersonii.AAC.1
MRGNALPRPVARSRRRLTVSVRVEHVIFVPGDGPWPSCCISPPGVLCLTNIPCIPGVCEHDVNV